MGRPDWDIEVQKTGFTNEAGRCLVMQVKAEGRTLIMVFLDAYGKLTRFADARRVLMQLALRCVEESMALDVIESSRRSAQNLEPPSRQSIASHHVQSAQLFDP